MSPGTAVIQFSRKGTARIALNGKTSRQRWKQYKRTVLVGTTDPYVLEYVASLLGEYGYAYIACRNAEDAFLKFPGTAYRRRPDRHQMPVFSGNRSLERYTSPRPDVPGNLMTAHAEVDIAVDAIKKGAFPTSS